MASLRSDPADFARNGWPISAGTAGRFHRNAHNGSYRWKKNDIHDLGFSGPAVTYCDVLFTERHLRTQLCRQGIDREYGTTILSRPEELVAHLRQTQISETQV